MSAADEGKRHPVKTWSDRERTLMDYLLERTPAAERERLEEALFGDPDLDEDLLSTTDDLIQAYLDETLAGEDRELFESRFLVAPEHRARLAFMRDLLTAVERLPRATNSRARPAKPVSLALRRWRSVTAAAAALMVGVLVAQFAGRPSVPPPTSGRTAAPPSVAAPEPPSEPTASSPPRSDPVHRVRLPRDSGRPVDVSVSVETRVLRLEVVVGQESPTFDAAVRSAEGAVVWRAEGLAPAGPGEPLVLSVPARIFPEGRYVLQVEGEPMRDAVPPRLEYELRVRVTREPGARP